MIQFYITNFITKLQQTSHHIFVTKLQQTSSSQNFNKHLITKYFATNYETNYETLYHKTFATNYETNYETLYHKTFATKLSQHLITKYFATNISSQSFIINLHQTFNELFLRNDIVSCIMYHNAL